MTQSGRILDAYVERGSRFLVDMQREQGLEFVLGKREGSYFWDIEGERRVLDCGNSGGVYSLGHRNPELLRCLLDAYETLDAGIWTLPNPEALAFQDLVAAFAPKPALCRSIITLASSNSIDLAAMFALRVTGRSRVLAYRHGYHGSAGFSALATGSEAEGWFDHYKLPRQFSGFFEEYGALASVEPLLGSDIAAVILEPMNYETFEPAPPGFLEGLARLCRKRGVLLVIDETRTGIGRSGKLWMTSHYDLEPDMLILGKGLGGGLFPVSALVTTRAIYDACMNAGHWGYMSSMAGGPINAIVGGKVLEMANRPALLDNVAMLEAAFRDAFLKLCEAFPETYAPAPVLGGIATLALRDEALACRMKGELFRRGVFCHSVSEIAPRVVKFFPCLTADPAIAEDVADALADVARCFTRGLLVNG